jgi:hypothetical protein
VLLSETKANPNVIRFLRQQDDRELTAEEAIEKYCRSDSAAQRLAYAGVSTD